MGVESDTWKINEFRKNYFKYSVIFFVGPLIFISILSYLLMRDFGLYFLIPIIMFLTISGHREYKEIKDLKEKCPLKYKLSKESLILKYDGGDFKLQWKNIFEMKHEKKYFTKKYYFDALKITKNNKETTTLGYLKRETIFEIINYFNDYKSKTN